jgi:hypothetical protein
MKYKEPRTFLFVSFGLLAFTLISIYFRDNLLTLLGLGESPKATIWFYLILFSFVACAVIVFSSFGFWYNRRGHLSKKMGYLIFVGFGFWLLSFAIDFYGKL